MDFKESNIIKILHPSIKNRFQDFTPSEFEDFFAKVFQDKDYNVEQTSYSGDYGADLIVTKDNTKTAVQIKRYAKSNKVGVQDINQIIGAKNYYNCDRALILTTSSFSKQGENLAKETSVECWKWEDLLELFRELYWDGLDYYSFYSNESDEVSEKTPLKIEFGNIEPMAELKGGELATIVHLVVENITRENINLEFELPTLITQNYEQIEGIYKLSTSFTGGVIYAGCKVDIGYIFSYSSIKKLEVGDKIISKFKIKIGDESESEKEYFSTYGTSEQSEKVNLYDDRISELENELESSDKKITESESNVDSLNDKLELLNSKIESLSKRQGYLIFGFFALIIILFMILKKSSR